MFQRADTHRRRGEVGFTLIEILVVIVILGILAAVVIFSVGGIIEKGDSSACKESVTTVEIAQEAYRAKNPTYAADVSTLVAFGFLRQTAAADAASKGITTDNTGAVVHTCTF